MQRYARLIQIALLLAANLLLASQASAGDFGRPARLVLAPGTSISDQYIVVLKQSGDIRAASARAGINPQHVYSGALNGFAARLTPEQVTAFQHDPNVEYIEQDQEISLDATQSMQGNGDLWGLDRIDQRALPLSESYSYKRTGSGVRVYVIDTGLQTDHPQFGSRAKNVYDAFGGDGADCNGHGTHVAGTVAGATYGVAKSALPRGVKVLNCDGIGSISGIIAAIDWVRQHAIKPAVANLSLGGTHSPSLNTSVTNLVKSGVFVAVAAGNENRDACNVSPANADGVYAVAASDRTDTRASFSNYGACVDGYAPGVAIKSTWIGNGTAIISGTSMAAPHVAGVAALYKHRYGDASAATITAWINNNATPKAIKSNAGQTPNRLLYKGGL